MEITENKLKLNDALFESYKFDAKKLPHEDYGDKHFLCALDVLRAHYVISDYFTGKDDARKEGALLGLKSVDMLMSAIGRQFVSFNGKVKWQGFYEVAATLFFGLVKNHPFHDGNKRTAFLSLALFLRKNDYGFRVNPSALEKLTLAVASSNYEFLSRYNFKALEQVHGKDDAVVYSVAAFLREKTRKCNRQYRRVRWSEFENSLARLGFYFGDRNRNKVEIYHFAREKIFGVAMGAKKVKVVDLKVDYPGAKCQMEVQTVKSILKKLNVVGSRFDYNSIFEEEPLYCMIQDFEDLIARLKDE